MHITGVGGVKEAEKMAFSEREEQRWSREEQRWLREGRSSGSSVRKHGGKPGRRLCVVRD